MLHKCANPACTQVFRRLSDGKLFQVESDRTSARPKLGSGTARERSPRRVEYYWLCDACALVLTLTFEEGRGMITVPLPVGTRKPPVTPVAPITRALGQARGARAS